ncbi:hypothetical protein M23134_01719 [Microscilla marina ATCC 23134]|uniref:Uncharacterized protein n=1 Tax=Microscilla marina ATCC 23134 TaxID=313606 RepID=A1ZSY5_MICM2|nr:hypothetical protein M23134_01719 [Microscilla marina ATCC 23134]
MSKGLNINDIPKENIFTTPPHYFEQLPLRIQQKIGLAEGIKLHDIPHHQVFTVPPHYFKALPQYIEQQIALREGLSLAKISPHLVFTTPALYFEELTESIEQKIQLLEAQSNALLPKNTAFSTPEGYFDDLAAQIQHRVTSQKTSGLSRFWFTVSELLQTKALRYVGALMGVLLMAFVGVWMFDQTNQALPTAQRSNGQALDSYSLAANKVVKKIPIDEIKTTNSLNIDPKNTIAQNRRVTTLPAQVKPVSVVADLNSLSAKDVSAFLAEVSPTDLEVLAEPVTENKEAEVETFLLNALESNKELLFEQLKDVDLKAIQKNTDLRK